MKFLISDTQPHRHTTIRSFLTEEAAVIAVLLAAVDLEWTLQRVIYILGSTPVKDQGKENRCEQYRAIWKKEVAADSSEELNQLIGNWAGLIRAYELRNELIHGKHGATGLGYATDRVNQILDASRKICQFVQNTGGNVYARLRRVRQSPRIATES